MQKDLLTIEDLSKEDIETIFDRAAFIKAGQTAGEPYQPLKGKTLGLLFKKLSTRTRLSFEVGMFHLGGSTLFLSPGDMQMDRGETIADSAKVFSLYLDALLIRTHSHAEIEDFARNASIPVINGLTGKCHPCQILSDIYTIREKFGKLNNIKVAYIGDGNNIAHSWLAGASTMGMRLCCACPSGYAPDSAIIASAEQKTKGSGGSIHIIEDPVEAVKDADIIYTDVWTSMGQEEEYKQRLQAFKGFQVNAELIKNAKPDALIMHCLPAHRGEEITSEVIDSSRSIVFEEAKNRLYVQNAILDILIT